MNDRISRFKNIGSSIIPPMIFRRIMLQKIASYNMDFSDFVFKIASSEEEFIGAFKLVKNSYIYRGIASEDKMKFPIQNLLPCTTIFIVKKNNKIVGTISLIEDSNLGLPIEKIHKTEINKIRKISKRIAEVGAMALEIDYRHTGLSIMLYSMIYQWIEYCRNINNIVVAVHPSMRYFYRNILLFRKLGGVKKYVELNNALSSMMLLDLSKSREKFYRIYHNKIIEKKNNLDFYNFFFEKNNLFDFIPHLDSLEFIKN